MKKREREKWISYSEGKRKKKGEGKIYNKEREWARVEEEGGTHVTISLRERERESIYVF